MFGLLREKKAREKEATESVHAICAIESLKTRLRNNHDIKFENSSLKTKRKTKTYTTSAYFGEFKKENPTKRLKMQNGFKLLIQLWLSFILDIVGQSNSTHWTRCNNLTQCFVIDLEFNQIEFESNAIELNWSVFVHAHLFFPIKKTHFFSVPQKISNELVLSTATNYQNQIGDQYTHLHTHEYHRKTKTHHRWVIYLYFHFSIEILTFRYSNHSKLILSVHAKKLFIRSFIYLFHKNQNRTT